MGRGWRVIIGMVVWVVVEVRPRPEEVMSEAMVEVPEAPVEAPVVAEAVMPMAEATMAKPVVAVKP